MVSVCIVSLGFPVRFPSPPRFIFTCSASVVGWPGCFGAPVSSSSLLLSLHGAAVACAHARAISRCCLSPRCPPSLMLAKKLLPHRCRVRVPRRARTTALPHATAAYYSGVPAVLVPFISQRRALQRVALGCRDAPPPAGYPPLPGGGPGRIFYHVRRALVYVGVYVCDCVCVCVPVCVCVGVFVVSLQLPFSVRERAARSPKS